MTWLHVLSLIIILHLLGWFVNTIFIARHRQLPTFLQTEPALGEFWLGEGFPTDLGKA